MREALASVHDVDLTDLPPAATAMYQLCRAWLAVQDKRFDTAIIHIRAALATVHDQDLGPYTGQRFVGPALNLAAIIALAQDDPATTVTLHRAAHNALTLDGRISYPPTASWATDLGTKARAALSGGTYSTAVERGSTLNTADALRLAHLRL